MFLKVIVAGAVGLSHCHLIDTCFPPETENGSSKQMRTFKGHLNGFDKSVAVRIIEVDELMLFDILMPFFFFSAFFFFQKSFAIRLKCVICCCINYQIESKIVPTSFALVFVGIAIVSSFIVADVIVVI